MRPKVDLDAGEAVSCGEVAVAIVVGQLAVVVKKLIGVGMVLGALAPDVGFEFLSENRPGLLRPLGLKA